MSRFSLTETPFLLTIYMYLKGSSKKRPGVPKRLRAYPLNLIRIMPAKGDTD